MKIIKLKRGEIRTRQCPNLCFLAWQDKQFTSILSTNTDPEPEVLGHLDLWTENRKAGPEEDYAKPAGISL